MSCFSKNILDYFYNIQNTGRILKPEAIGRAGSKAEGTVIEFSWRVRNGIIEDARFRTFGDVNAIAISSIVTTMMTGNSIDEVLAIRPEDILEQLRETKPNYLYLIDLSLSALENTYNNFLKKNAKQEVRKNTEFANSLRHDLNKIQGGEFVDGAEVNLNLAEFDIMAETDDEQTYLNNLNEYNRHIEQGENSFESLIQKLENKQPSRRGRPRKERTEEELQELQNKVSRGRGRPRKERTLEELEAEKNKVSRGRGRPKKERTLEELEKLNAPKGKRGRPRKERTEEELLELANKVSRGRGRPKKERTEEELLELQNKVSRGRGRPRKDATQSNSYTSTFNNSYANKFETKIDDETVTPYANTTFNFGFNDDELDELDENEEMFEEDGGNDNFKNNFADIDEGDYNEDEIYKESEFDEDTEREFSLDSGVYDKELRDKEENDLFASQVKKGRGRPRKERTLEELEKLNAPKGKRGRPRKERTEEELQEVANKVSRGRGRPRKERSLKELEAEKNKVSRGRGRPKKERTPEELEELQNKVTRGRGRPKKERTEEELQELENKVSRGRGRPRKNAEIEFKNNYNAQPIANDDFVLPKKEVVSQSTLDFILNGNEDKVYDNEELISTDMEEIDTTNAEVFGADNGAEEKIYNDLNDIDETDEDEFGQDIFKNNFADIEEDDFEDRELDEIDDEIEDEENEVFVPQVKKGRGRPRKEKTEEDIEAENGKVSRGRGRPKKERTPEELQELQNKVSRGRGRPKKERTPEELEKLNAPKSKRGRPRKETAFTIQSVKPIDNEKVVERKEPKVEIEASVSASSSNDRNESEINISKKVVEENNEYVIPTMPQNSPFAPAQNKYGVGVTPLYKPTITKTVTKTTTTNYTYNEKTVTTLTSNQPKNEVDDEIEVEKVENKKLEKASQTQKNDNTKTLKELMEEDDAEPTNVTPLSDSINDILSSGGSIQDALKALMKDD